MRPVGERAWLVELDSNASVHAVARAAHARYGDALQEVVPGHVTVLLVWKDAAPSAAALVSELDVPGESEIASQPNRAEFQSTSPGSVTLPVSYDGPDLERVAEALGLSVEATIELHSATVFRVAFMGFAPGFPYLIPEPKNPRAEALVALPRLTTPRTEVPAGSVAVAAGYCGVYPRSSPGGWNLLGRTGAVLFDAAGDPPALLRPGTEVRFVSV